MLRVKHEPWCETPNATDDGFCGSEYVYFGPDDIPGAPGPVGGMFGIQREGGDVEVAIDFRYNDGVMSFGALRTIREALAESPAELLAGFDQLIALLGDAVPPRRELNPSPA